MLGVMEVKGSEVRLPSGHIIANDRRFNFSSSSAAYF